MTEELAALEVRRALPHTWGAFFGRFGRLQPIQILAIPLILRGRNAIICSPTASGKTEAVVAPVAELLLREPPSGLGAIYISPTRALLNDLYHRLVGPLSTVGLSLAVKTAERRMFNPLRPQTFLLATPESLDSLVCRSPHALAQARFLILDEIHLLDGTYRGDQLRLLTKRISHLSKLQPRCYALSATLADVRETASRYFADFEVLALPGARELEYALFPSVTLALAEARRRRLQKILVFCNRRKEVEDLITECRRLWPQDHLVAHHGKLSKPIREAAEQFMRESKWGLCIATMTLEIGIDIGEIDLVILYGAPWSVSSLLQRVGRGNRRKGRTLAFGVYRSPAERIQFEEMFELAKGGVVERTAYTPDLSVVVQQVFSCLYEHRTGIDREFLFQLFSGFCSPAVVDRLLYHLESLGYVELRRSKWFASPKVIEMGERGTVHSNIPETRDYRVLDETTGVTLGEISTAFVEGVFRIAGKAWRVVRIEGSRIYVRPASGGEVARFAPAAPQGAFSKLLPPELQ